MDIQYGKPAESIRRFSLFKWAVAAVLLVLFLFAWLGRTERTMDSATNGPGTGADAGAGSSAGGALPSGTAGGDAAQAGAPTSLAIDLAGDGSFKVQGTVADEVTRNQWLNAIRIGAQGARVIDELRIGAVSPAAAGWPGQLSSLVALMRERHLAGLRLDGDQVVLKGAVASQADKGQVEKIIQARLPSGYRLDSQLAVSALAAGAARTAAESATSSSATGAPSVAGSAAGGTAKRTETGTSAQVEAGREPAEAAGKPDAGRTAARKPANCPRQLRSLAQSVYFKTDAATISSPDRTRLQRLGECLGRARVRIVGHADPRHTDEYNLELSERRARAVADELTAAGAAPSRISVIAAGKAKPAGKGNSRQALQRSRRVDIQIR